MGDRRGYENPFLPSVAGLAGKIKAHWRRTRPNLFLRLANSGDLEEDALREATMTYRLAEQLEAKGLQPAKAASQALEALAFSDDNPPAEGSG
ncbi:MAG: hypothetical protein M1401_09380 [Chloroflexi bacterium]|nr:hypothetical protein [Chloroflexota bacterium]MCL5109057.1 hypothetical protein [Chloroflexota bacterium]